MRRRGGFSLPEMIVATASMAFIFGIVFLLFSYAVNGYRLLDVRQGMQGNALKARNSLERDFSLSHYDSTESSECHLGNDLAGARRDAVCMLGLSNWNDADRFSDLGYPRWDRFIVYYATTTEEAGRLIRLELKPVTIADPAQGLRIAPLSVTFLAGLEAGGPGSDWIVVNRQTIMDKLDVFEAQCDDTTQTVSVRLTGSQTDALRPGGMKRIDEGMEAVFRFDPMNTSPRL